MDKRQLKNTLGLYKLRIKSRESFIGMLCIYWGLFFYFAMDLVTNLKGVLNSSSEIGIFNIYTYTAWALWVPILFCGSMTLYYKNDNHKFSVFPQDNKTRFLSYVLYNYINLFKLSIFTLFLYLLQYGCFSIVGHFNPNIHFAYPINFFFLISGFIVNQLYCLIILSINTLIGTLQRKFNLYFIIGVVVIGVTSIVIARFSGNAAIFKGIIGIIEFFTKEPSLWIFIIKALILWALLFGLAWFINNHTVYYKSDYTEPSQGKTAAIGISLTIFIGIVIFSVSSTSYNNRTSFGTDNSNMFIGKNETFKVELFNDIFKTKDIEIPISNINPEEPVEIIKEFHGGGEDILVSRSSDASMNEKVENIIVKFKMPYNCKNLVDLNKYTNPVVTARLEGNKLFINYTEDENQKVIFLNSYGLMSQFQYFKGQNLYKESFGEMSGNGSGSIIIVYPEGLKIIEN